MEVHIIKSLFEEVEKRGARITRYIADANTYHLLKTLEFGDQIKKIDCVNHMKCYFMTFILD